jgi:hypothetical protein
MKRIWILATMVVLLAVPVTAEASHDKPTTYLSPTGDLFQSVKKVDGVRRLRISLAEKFFEEFKLCVRAPDDTRVCKVFEIQDHGATPGRSVRWNRQFPNKGLGAYVVIWRTGGHQVGKRLGFHR